MENGRPVGPIPSLGLDQPDDAVARSIGRNSRSRARIAEPLRAHRAGLRRQFPVLQGEGRQIVATGQNINAAVPICRRCEYAAAEPDDLHSVAVAGRLVFSQMAAIEDIEVAVFAAHQNEAPKLFQLPGSNSGPPEPKSSSSLLLRDCSLKGVK